MRINIYTSKETLTQEFTKWFTEYIGSSEEHLHIALSGGSTPKMIFQALATNYKDQVDWSKVSFYWGDERCVPPTDGDSNYGMTAELLLSKVPVPPQNIHRIKGEDNPQEEAIRYGKLLEKNLKLNHNMPSFDLVILGMGDDGHTASIFPHEIALWESESNCVVATHTESGQKRVSITGKVINNASTVAFLVSGSNKAEKLREILKYEGSFSDYPASLVAPSGGNLLWFLDKEAAKEL
ncbi:MAG: 6-phosphogluconolactonase [Flavobacteriaceae bacterium]